MASLPSSSAPRCGRKYGGVSVAPGLLVRDALPGEKTGGLLSCRSALGAGCRARQRSPKSGSRKCERRLGGGVHMYARVYVSVYVRAHAVPGTERPRVREAQIVEVTSSWVFRGDFAGFSETPRSCYSPTLPSSFAKDHATKGGCEVWTGCQGSARARGPRASSVRTIITPCVKPPTAGFVQMI